MSLHELECNLSKCKSKLFQYVERVNSDQVNDVYVYYLENKIKELTDKIKQVQSLYKKVG